MREAPIFVIPDQLRRQLAIVIIRVPIRRRARRRGDSVFTGTSARPYTISPHNSESRDVCKTTSRHAPYPSGFANADATLKGSKSPPPRPQTLDFGHPPISHFRRHRTEKSYRIAASPELMRQEIKKTSGQPRWPGWDWARFDRPEKNLMGKAEREISPLYPGKITDPRSGRNNYRHRPNSDIAFGLWKS